MENIQRKKIAIIGTGAIGGYYGIALERMGHDVHFLLNSDYAYVKEHGLTLRSDVLGEIRIPKVQAYDKASEMPICDIVIIGLKTTNNEKVLPNVLPYITDENTVVILIQNGLGMEKQLASWFPNLQIAGGIALICSHKEKNGIIVHEKFGSIDLGSYNVRDTRILDALAADFNAFDIPATVQDLKLLRWKKLVWNMTFNGLSVVLDCNTDVLLSEYLERAKIIMNEVRQAAKVNAIDIPEAVLDAMLPFTQKMGSYAPSMRFDYLNGSVLELDYLYARPIEAARLHGYEMKETIVLYKELLAIQSGMNLR